MSTIKVDTIATRTGSGNITASNALTVSGNLTQGSNTQAIDGLGVKTGENITFAESGTNAYANIFRQSSSGALVLGQGYQYHSNANQMASSVDSSWVKNAIAVGNNNGIQFFCDSASTVAKGTAIAPTEVARFTTAGLHLGGTGAANALDDYEEGSWTPNLIGSTTNPSSAVTGTGSYTKIGRLIYARYFISNADVAGASGGIRLNGLPFNNSGGHVSGDVMVYYRKTVNADAVNLSPYLASNQLYFYQTRNDASETWGEIIYDLTGASTGFYLWGSVIYETAS